ncbi:MULTISPECIES: adenosylcobinamide amidohydrolase [Micromonospora]|uniref:Adenosylcobinamide amidohydrolase n=1 Tax=Micromonospora yangpuensis TaxID=683228 RepID=A0A1C6VFB0_9ACTN|nr:adenosylcobinamide amidohydrolase [Micromonospora yangpuensis]GGM31617.1 adenosylcobinamide amidohydrolase [Micromonospora yangpuensis]SCL65022.1 Adenosylcobinamide amidohydrolase [Micromonospora yangpuensis]
MLNEPGLTSRVEQGWELPLLVWRAERPLRAVSSAPLGGGLGTRGWVVNATVPMSYRRDDPADHLAELAADLGLDGPGVGLLTGVDVADVVSRSESGVRVWATVGLGLPIWAADPAADPATTAGRATHPAAVPAGRAGRPSPGEGSRARPPAPRVGTVNIVGYVPIRLTDAALVNAVATATEAKAQAIIGLGHPGTGTPTDAVTVLCPVDGPVADYGGPRSEWGALLARAVYAAVRAGGLADRPPWSERAQGRKPDRYPPSERTGGQKSDRTVIVGPEIAR